MTHCHADAGAKRIRSDHPSAVQTNTSDSETFLEGKPIKRRNVWIDWNEIALQILRVKFHLTFFSGSTCCKKKHMNFFLQLRSSYAWLDAPGSCFAANCERRVPQFAWWSENFDAGACWGSLGNLAINAWRVDCIPESHPLTEVKSFDFSGLWMLMFSAWRNGCFSICVHQYQTQNLSLTNDWSPLETNIDKPGNSDILSLVYCKV